MSLHRAEQIKKGDHVTFLGTDRSCGWYVALADFAPGKGFTGFLEDSRGYMHPTHQVGEYSGPGFPCTILNRDPNKEINTVSNNNNDVKLELAVDYALQARFSYQGEDDDAPRVRRLKVEDFDGEYVEGQSFDENGRHEGYRRFRLDRIQDSVVVR